MKLKYWIISARLRPLILGIGPVLIGICLSFFGWNSFDWILNLVVLFCVLCLQIGTHFFNDAFDFIKGADISTRKGPIRAIQKKMITPLELIRAACFCLFLAVVASIYLILQDPVPVLIVGFFSLMLTYCYTGSRYSLAYTGLADSFVILFFGVIPVTMVFYLNTGDWNFSAGLVGFQYGFLALSILVINNLRDYLEDKAAQKKTLVVRFGLRFGLSEWTVAHYIPYLLGIYFVFLTGKLIFFLPFLILPLSIYIHLTLLKANKKSSLYPKVFKLSLRHYLLFVFVTCFMHLWFS